MYEDDVLLDVILILVYWNYELQKRVTNDR